MSGPNNIEVLKKRAGRQESWAFTWGIVVGLGLIIEYGQEILDCFKNLHAPSVPLVGGLLVTLGVFGEVFASRRALKAAEEISAHAESAVALANKQAAEAIDRATKAEQATADADLKRVELEAIILRRALSRKLTPEEQSALINSLFEYAGQEYALYISSIGEQVQDSEQVFFAQQLNGILLGAGWKQVVNEPFSTPLIAKGVVIFSQGAYAGKATIGLQLSLAKLQLSCQPIFNSPPVPIIIGVGPI